MTGTSTVALPDLAPAAGAARDDWRTRLPAVRRRRLSLWFWSIAAATFLVIVIGGITRLTQSGLSIVDWQPLVGAVPPLTEAQWTEAFDKYRQFPEYQQLRRGMTLAEFKVIFFWEYLHRLIARLIGAVFLIPFLLFWRAGYLTRPVTVRALGLFTLGALQGALGWLMVSSGLVDRPSVSHYRLAAHLSLALVILGTAVWLARELASAPAHSALKPHVLRLSRVGLTIVGTLVAAQIVWGAFVAGLKAGLVYNTFPLMAGQLLPPGGLSYEPAILNLVQNMVTVQWVHRLLGTLLLAAAIAFFIRIRKTEPDRTTARLNIALLSLIASQYLLGVLTLLSGVAVSLASVHQAVAAVIVGVWVVWMHRTVRGISTPNFQLPTPNANSQLPRRTAY